MINTPSPSPRSAVSCPGCEQEKATRARLVDTVSEWFRDRLREESPADETTLRELAGDAWAPSFDRAFPIQDDRDWAYFLDDAWARARRSS